MVFTVCSLNMPTDKAPLRCMARIDLFEFDPMHSCFVGEEVLKLCKSPITMLSAIISPSNRRPLSNMGQIFDPYRAIRVFGLNDQLLRNNVIDIFLKTLLPTCQFFQVTLGRLASALLQGFTQLGIALTGILNTFTAELLSVTGHGDIGYTHVDTQRLIGLPLIGVGNIARCQQEKLFGRFGVDQISFALLILQQFFLTIPSTVGDVQPPTNRPNTNRFFIGVVSQNTVIIGNRAMWLERALAFFIQFVSIGYFGKHPYNHLSRNTSFSPEWMVKRFMQVKSTEKRVVPCELTDVITQSVSGFKRLQEVDGLFRRRIQSDLSNKFHTITYSTFSPIYQVLKGVSASILHT